jgi:ClpX C4-type zinc finger protein
MLRCSFCRRTDAEVTKLVAGPVWLFFRRVYICDRCAAEANRIMAAHPGEPLAPVKAGSLLGRTYARLSRWTHKTLIAVTG